MGNFIGITRAVRQKFIPDTRLQEVRPGTEEDDEFAEKIQTVAMSEAISREGERRDPDPDMSLITDFQVITDIRGKLPPRPPPLPLQPPLSHTEWESLRDGEGRISPRQQTRFRAIVFSGVSPFSLLFILLTFVYFTFLLVLETFILAYSLTSIYLRTVYNLFSVST
ncbi:hypothetical protein GBAR_LOCUS27596 [Geodia barretti]|uniref:Uncharacterized protein n=1 Tax=Geodia barretti TaxID=519541 RepID=A0AA35TNL6_GEOBA|nr:hypothetical protein GBAR_LOCUS27596 [Geodia barretti]